MGLTGLAWIAGLVVGSLGGAAVLDAWDRRRLLLVAQLGIAAGIGILLVVTLLGNPSVWAIYAGLAIMAAFSAIDSPTRSAMTPRLVGAEMIPSAQALNQVVWNASALFGPALAGVLIAARRRGLGLRDRPDLGALDVDRRVRPAADAARGSVR